MSGSGAGRSEEFKTEQQREGELVDRFFRTMTQVHNALVEEQLYQGIFAALQAARFTPAEASLDYLIKRRFFGFGRHPRGAVESVDIKLDWLNFDLRILAIIKKLVMDEIPRRAAGQERLAAIVQRIDEVSAMGARLIATYQDEKKSDVSNEGLAEMIVSSSLAVPLSPYQIADHSGAMHYVSGPIAQMNAVLSNTKITERERYVQLENIARLALERLIAEKQLDPSVITGPLASVRDKPLEVQFMKVVIDGQKNRERIEDMLEAIFNAQEHKEDKRPGVKTFFSTAEGSGSGAGKGPATKGSATDHKRGGPGGGARG